MKSWKKVALLLAGAGLLAYFAYRHAGELREAFRVARGAELWPLGAALLFQLLYYLCAGLVVRQALRLVDFRAPYWWTVQATFLLIFISRIVPGPAATGPAAMYYLLERRGLSKARSAFVGPIFYAVDYGVFLILLAAGLLSLSLHHELPKAVAIATPFLIVAAAVGAAFLHMFHRPDRLQTILERFSRVLDHAARVLHLRWRVSPGLPQAVATTAGEIRDRLADHPGIGWRILAAGVAMLLCDVGTMACSFRAFGPWLPLSTSLLGFCLATVGAIISFLPGGLGTFEAAMVLGFVGLGAPKPVALAATLVYRVIATWFPASLGVFAYHAFLAARKE